MSRGGRRERRTALAAVLLGGAALLVLAAGYVWMLGGTAPREGWSLIDADGHVVTDRDLRGRAALVYFGYTSCPDICPATLAHMAAALDRLGARAGQVRAVFITVDPGRDRPAVLRRYLAGFGGDVLGLTGTAGGIDAARREYGIAAIAHGAPGGGGAIDHTAVLLLIGPDGGFVAALPAAATGAEIAARLLVYLAAPGGRV